LIAIFIKIENLSELGLEGGKLVTNLERNAYSYLFWS